jgi:hypothetical protein
MERNTEDQESRLEAVIAGARGIERPEDPGKGERAEEALQNRETASPPPRRWLRLRWPAQEETDNG